MIELDKVPREAPTNKPEVDKVMLKQQVTRTEKPVKALLEQELKDKQEEYRDKFNLFLQIKKELNVLNDRVQALRRMLND